MYRKVYTVHAYLEWPSLPSASFHVPDLGPRHKKKSHSHVACHRIIHMLTFVKFAFMLLLILSKGVHYTELNALG